MDQMNQISNRKKQKYSIRLGRGETSRQTTPVHWNNVIRRDAMADIHRGNVCMHATNSAVAVGARGSLIYTPTVRCTRKEPISLSYGQNYIYIKFDRRDMLLFIFS